jgi:hypothetical protein
VPFSYLLTDCISPEEDPPKYICQFTAAGAEASFVSVPTEGLLGGLKSKRFVIRPYCRFSMSPYCRFYTNRDYYDGDFIDSVRHGQGTLITAAGVKYEGEFRNNVYNGYGILSWPPFEENGVKYVGRRFEGDFKDGQRHGKGIFMVGNGDYYSGMFEKNLYHGAGTLVSCELGKFEGDWSCGKPSGRMRIEYHNGNVYEGEMLIGYYHGKGKLVYSEDKGWYEGQWLRNDMHGQGDRLYSNGNRYTGTFSEGHIHGEGRMAFSNGDQYVGEWKNGRFDGKGVILYERGDRYVVHMMVQIVFSLFHHADTTALLRWAFSTARANTLIKTEAPIQENI